MRSHDLLPGDGSQHSIDTHLENLNKLIREMVEQCVPVRDFYTKYRPVPWITSKSRGLWKDRDKTYRKFKRSGHSLAWESYLKLRRRAQLL